MFTGAFYRLPQAASGNKKCQSNTGVKTPPKKEVPPLDISSEGYIKLLSVTDKLIQH